MERVLDSATFRRWFRVWPLGLLALAASLAPAGFRLDPAIPLETAERALTESSPSSRAASHPLESGALRSLRAGVTSSRSPVQDPGFAARAGASLPALNNAGAAFSRRCALLVSASARAHYGRAPPSIS